MPTEITQCSLSLCLLSAHYVKAEAPCSLGGWLMFIKKEEEVYTMNKKRTQMAQGYHITLVSCDI